MSVWTDGYVSDIQYTAGFYRELTPAYLSTLLNIQGYHAPDATGSFTYCELGCGQGFGTNILAASYPNGRFWGVDFNPAQISNARRLASKAGLTNIEFIEESFEGMAKGACPDLPSFDYITLHGIYSWISIENKGFIVDFISRYLKPGGVVYVSYNCLPGWANVAPVQRLIREHAALNPGRSDQQMEGAMRFIGQLREANAGYFVVNQSMNVRLDGMKTANRNYLAHEYLNGYWYPAYHSDVVREFDRAKLNFAASATVLENIDIFSVPEPVRKVLADVTDPVMIQTVKDFAINQAFRKDIFIRGASKMGRLEHEATLRGLTLRASVRRQDSTTDLKTPLGSAKGIPEVYDTFMDMACGSEAVSIGDLLANPILAKHGLPVVIQTYQMLLANVQVHPAMPAADKVTAAAFNLAVADEVVLGADFGAAASPVLGTGLGLTFIEACGLRALAGMTDVNLEVAVGNVWKEMRRGARRLLKEGKPIQSDEENIAGLKPLVQQMIDTRLPLWRKLGII